MKNNNYDFHESNLQLIALAGLFFLVLSIGYATANIGLALSNLSRAQTPWQNQGTVEFIPGLKTVGELPSGGLLSPSDTAYCLEDEDPEGCSDKTAFHIPKGNTGKAGQCGTIIQQAHLIAPSLQRNKTDLLDSLNYNLKNCNYSTDIYSEGYLPTYFIIDAYNLAGFHELSKENPGHTLGLNLYNWWKSQTKKYKFLPYSTSAIYQYANGQQDLTGCVIFISQPSGVHAGIINSFQLVNQNGDGVLSILQSGVKYFIERYEVVGWKIKNLTLNPKEPNKVAGFGCLQ
ncbi:hypothetical protein A2954_06470 [Candidatus Roizmanbacteria bacterium RIFCSPLOWO2_01_FULL_37_12]|uniref:Uncharacterized protein n=1 Tax=Candidatus Roizmanbacteria bacterium RIFCSPLOWO2_01_FULL_37_12 TaxID=1802056 RepID=A0A1F7I9X3_9BACT|nr:MAG: hypothetical protein A2768_00670 [Candidatus Roizmanbacteria bacterium RIFCSPHIGHO2_01_FULL_37_16]OGK26829.1 MAG: hypothetical protein A3D76_05085 [Candidatus Roizmanbacteria bacterium RIFCSPHIGHO2_02_FULL_37_9b]OGK40153.1 MAG: hypothetical protein A2954_06470 [Candidatus Roizmanbacteria bacterium RIFCSPLOWO2_01_FULL_37_12]